MAPGNQGLDSLCEYPLPQNRCPIPLWRCEFPQQLKDTGKPHEGMGVIGTYSVSKRQRGCCVLYLGGEGLHRHLTGLYRKGSSNRTAFRGNGPPQSFLWFPSSCDLRHFLLSFPLGDYVQPHNFPKLLSTKARYENSDFPQSYRVQAQKPTPRSGELEHRPASFVSTRQ